VWRPVRLREVLVLAVPAALVAISIASCGTQNDGGSTDGAERSTAATQAIQPPGPPSAGCPITADELSAIFDREIEPVDVGSDAPEIVCSFNAGLEDPSIDPEVLVIRTAGSPADARRTYDKRAGSESDPELTVTDRPDLGEDAFVLANPETGVGLSAYFPDGDDTVVVTVAIGHDDASEADGHDQAEQVIAAVRASLGLQSG